MPDSTYFKTQLAFLCLVTIYGRFLMYNGTVYTIRYAVQSRNVQNYIAKAFSPCLTMTGAQHSRVAFCLSIG